MKPSKRRKSNPWDNPLTPEHKAIRLATKVLSEDSPHKFPPGMGGPEPDLSGVTLADAIAVVKGMWAAPRIRLLARGLPLTWQRFGRSVPLCVTARSFPRMSPTHLLSSILLPTGSLHNENPYRSSGRYGGPFMGRISRKTRPQPRT